MDYALAGGGCFVVTALLHSALLRFRPGLGLLVSSLGSNLAVMAAALMIAGLGLAPGGFEGVWHGTVTAFFAYQLFFFLGPATADRSMTAHLLLYLQSRGSDGAGIEALLTDYEPEQFLHKRLQECTSTGLISSSGDAVRLAWRGRLMARTYAALMSMYRLKRRPQWRDSFRRGAS